jgi:hypothetical protein
MNQRERILVIGIASFLLLFVLWYVWGTVSDMYSSRRKQIDVLQADVSKQKKLQLQTQAAALRMREYEKRSLPPQGALARSAYQSWLLEQLGNAGVRDAQVTASSGKPERNLYVTHNYEVSGKASLPHIVQLLHAFYSADYLHRLKKVILRPINNSKDLDVILTVEALSLERAPASTALHERPANRLALSAREDYVRIISERNLFSPPNQEPRISGLGSQKGVRGQPVDIATRGTDPDKLDKLTYKLVKSSAPEARLDASTGRLSWTPRTNGKFEFLVRATDDGYPPKSSKDESLVITVEDPPPPPPPPPVKLAFDDAKFTVLSAVIDISGDGQIWLYVRPRGQTLKLAVGDKFEVGSVKGIVTSIGRGDFTFESGGKEHRLSRGEILEQAVEVQ